MDPGHDTIKVYRPDDITDADGSVSPDKTRESANATLIATIEGCSVQPFLMSEKLQFENNADRTSATTTFRVFAPPAAAVILYSDWIEYQGTMYEAFGFPGVWRVEAAVDHVEFLIRRRTG